MTIPIAKPLLGEEEKQAVIRVIDSGALAQGAEVEAFEKEFADWNGSAYAMAVNSGTAALQLALQAHEFPAGAEVITTPFTFMASTSSILYAGLTPVFADIDEATMNIDPATVERLVTPNTVAILPVHLFGLSCDMTALEAIATKHNLIIIEDACQSHGAEWAGSRVATKHTGTFSFYPTKNMTTTEGGMVTTPDETIAKRLAVLRSQGMEKRYYHDVLSYNFRMTNLEAAIGREQLKKLDGFTAKRQANADYLRQHLTHRGLAFQHVPNQAKHVYHQFTIRVTPDFGLTRDQVLEKLTAAGIGTSVFYPLPVNRQRPIVERGLSATVPVAERVANEVLSIPVHPSLAEADLQTIVTTINGL